MIDVHSHLYPRPYIELLKQREQIPRIVTRNGVEEFVIFPEEDGVDGVGGRPIDSQFWDLDRKLQFMDEMGIDPTVVSLGNPWLDPFESQEAEEAAQTVNRFMASYATAYGRIVGLGIIVPTSNVDFAIVGARAIAAMHGLHGMVLGPRIAGLWFDDPALHSFWTEVSTFGRNFIIAFRPNFPPRFRPNLTTSIS